MTSESLSRRAWIGGALSILATPGCSRPGGEPGVVRLGVMSNLTHAPVLAGIASGRIARAIAPARLETKAFRAGPRVAEALLGGALDIAVAGPAAIVFTHARHGAGTFHAVTGCASGGASLVVMRRERIMSAADLAGKSVAVTQVGSTQDVSLRKYLHVHGLERKERGGSVTIHAFAGATIKLQLSKGELSAAWLPEPWATRIVRELDAVRLVDERDLWPNRRFCTALVVARGAFRQARPTDVDIVKRAIEAEIERAIASPRECEELAYAQIKQQVGNAGPRPLFHEAWSMVEFTRDPLAESVATFARDACDLGLMPETDCRSLFAST